MATPTPSRRPHHWPAVVTAAELAEESGIRPAAPGPAFAYCYTDPIPVGSYADPVREEPAMIIEHETLSVAAWTGVLAELDTDSTDLRRLANPGLTGPRTNPMPLPLHYGVPVGGRHDVAELAGMIDRVWIDGGSLYGLGRAWHPELVARLRDDEPVAVGVRVGDVEHAVSAPRQQPARAGDDTLTLSGHAFGTLSTQQQAASLTGLTGLTVAEVPELGAVVARGWRLIDVCAYPAGVAGAFPTARITLATLRQG